MASKKISQLPPAANVANANVFPQVAAGVTEQASISQLRSNLGFDNPIANSLTLGAGGILVVSGANIDAVGNIFTNQSFGNDAWVFNEDGSATLTGGSVTALGVWTLPNLLIPTAGKLSIQSGANQRAGNLTLVGGTKTVANTTVTANTIVILTRKSTGGTIGFAVTYTLNAGVSFTVTSDNALDTSTYSYLLLEVP